MRLVIKCWIICSVTEERMVFAVDLQRWVRGHSTCWPVLLTSESNLCWGPLVTGTVSWGGTGWKKMNSWTDFLSPCCLMLGANLLISIQKANLMFVLTCHISLEWFFQSLCILISVQVCFLSICQASLWLEGHQLKSLHCVRKKMCEENANWVNLCFPISYHSSALEQQLGTLTVFVKPHQLVRSCRPSACDLVRVGIS